jgi:hypothetical protein
MGGLDVFSFSEGLVGVFDKIYSFPGDVSYKTQYLEKRASVMMKEQGRLGSTKGGMTPRDDREGGRRKLIERAAPTDMRKEPAVMHSRTRRRRLD